MYRHTLVTAVLLAAASVRLSAQSQIKPGTIAIFGVGASERTPEVRQTADNLQGQIEEAVQKSGRFTEVLPRTASVDTAVKGEIDRSTRPASLGSLVRINQEGQLNANYVIDGWIERHSVTETAPDTNGRQIKRQYRADLSVRIRIVNVETGALVFSDAVQVNSAVAAVGSVERSGRLRGAIGSIVRKGAAALGNATLVDADTPQQAIQRARDNAPPKIFELIDQKFGYTVFDYEGEEGPAMVLVLRGGAALQRGDRLVAYTTTATKMQPITVRTIELGKLEVTRTSDGNAHAKITSGSEAILKTIKAESGPIQARRESSK